MAWCLWWWIKMICWLSRFIALYQAVENPTSRAISTIITLHTAAFLWPNCQRFSRTSPWWWPRAVVLSFLWAKPQLQWMPLKNWRWRASGIIRGLMGIENTSHDARISFMRGDTPLQKMKWIIDQGECDCVFVLPANSFDQVEAVADQNLTMPPKSTWIEPKLLTGFVSQQFD